jgi:hypothetical protein
MQAQNSLADRKTRVIYEIIPILSDAENVYTSGRKYNRITNFTLKEENDCYITFYSFDHPIQPGESESDKSIGWHKTVIDFSRVERVFSGKNNYGHESIFVRCKPGAECISTQYSESDAYGNNYISGPVSLVTETGLPIESDELVDLLRELSGICSEDRAKNPGTFNKDPKAVPRAKTDAELQAEAQSEAIDNVTSLLTYFNWELKGSISAIFKGGYGKDSIKDYSVDDARMSFIIGNKAVRLNLSPLGFSWVTMPEFTKYNEDGIEIGTGKFHKSRFYSPAIGLTFCILTKKGRKDIYRGVEFPLSVNFMPLLFPKNKDLILYEAPGDSRIKDYLTGFSYFGNASFGINAYPSDGFGIGLSGGVNYLSVKATENEVTATDSAFNTTSFFIKTNPGKKIFPAIDLRIILRF